ncbi:hypothetical protein QJS04_geneDACA015540 [Acorus gramineus]|uniref:Uncharacterized protein n=1 Tax=Acorus gramineus TaxID=55184 RepID=A0AAV9ASY7_ACOGR|nr:hypothetical protein QJS04_geneDACA015540 [Acorus gramineus]
MHSRFRRLYLIFTASQITFFYPTGVTGTEDVCRRGMGKLICFCVLEEGINNWRPNYLFLDLLVM